MTLAESEEFKRQVKEFAASDAIEELLNILENKFTQDWKDSAPSETDKRVYSYMMVRAVDALRNEIKSIALGDAVNAWNRERKSKAV
jgi:hypothetical protein